MNEDFYLDEALTRIETATNSIREAIGESGPIEDVADAVDTLKDDYDAAVEENASLTEQVEDLQEQLEEVTPHGTINITENGDNIDIAHYATANVSVEGGAGDAYVVSSEEEMEEIEDPANNAFCIVDKEKTNINISDWDMDTVSRLIFLPNTIVLDEPIEDEQQTFDIYKASDNTKIGTISYMYSSNQYEVECGFDVIGSDGLQFQYASDDALNYTLRWCYEAGGTKIREVENGTMVEIPSYAIDVQPNNIEEYDENMYSFFKTYTEEPVVITEINDWTTATEARTIFCPKEVTIDNPFTEEAYINVEDNTSTEIGVLHYYESSDVDRLSFGFYYDGGASRGSVDYNSDDGHSYYVTEAYSQGSVVMTEIEDGYIIVIGEDKFIHTPTITDSRLVEFIKEYNEEIVRDCNTYQNIYDSASTWVQKGMTVPTETLTITNNGNYNVLNYANANVDVSSSDAYVVNSVAEMEEIENPAEGAYCIVKTSENRTQVVPWSSNTESDVFYIPNTFTLTTPFTEEFQDLIYDTVGSSVGSIEYSTRSDNEGLTINIYNSDVYATLNAHYISDDNYTYTLNGLIAADYITSEPYKNGYKITIEDDNAITIPSVTNSQLYDIIGYFRTMTVNGCEVYQNEVSSGQGTWVKKSMMIPTEVLDITSNGSYNVLDKEYVSVNVAAGNPDLYAVDSDSDFNKINAKKGDVVTVGSIIPESYKYNGTTWERVYPEFIN